MKQDLNQGRGRQGFEERLLVELKGVIVARARSLESSSVAPSGSVSRFRGWRARVAIATGLAAVLTAALVVIPSTMGGGGVRPAYAVTENDDGTVTVEINSIEDGDGLEWQLEDAGVSASVRFLPPGKLCNPRTDGREGTGPPIQDRMTEMTRPRLRVARTGAGGFIFTVDKGRLLPGYTLLVFTQYDGPEDGQSEPRVPSIAAEYTQGDIERCDLVDGDVGGWPFQQGADPGGK